MPVHEHDLQEILRRVHGPLKEVLVQELAEGNTVTEVAASWPMKNANVWLSQRFHFDYTDRFPSLRYRCLEDPRAWLEEYVDSERGLLLAVSASARHPQSQRH
jgi:hypothetical protein